MGGKRRADGRKRARRGAAGALVVLAAGLVGPEVVGPGTARAQTTHTWTGNINANWATAFVSPAVSSNWLGNGLPASAASTRLEFLAGASNKANSNDLANPFTLNRLTFGAADYQIAGNTLSFVAFGADGPRLVHQTAGTNTIGATVAVGSATTLLADVANAGGTLVLSGFVNGGGVTKTGAGNLSLTGTDNLTGAFSAERGITTLSSGGTLTSGGGAVATATTGATVGVTGANSFWTVNGDLTVGGMARGVVRAESGGAVNVTGATRLTAGANSDLVLDGGTFATGTLVGSAGARLVVGSSGGTLNLTTDSTFDGTLTGTGGLAKEGAGALRVNGGTHALRGLAVNAGSLSLAGGARLTTTDGYVDNGDGGQSLAVTDGSRWDASDLIYFGTEGGGGRFDVTQGGAVTTPVLVVFTGTLALTGAGSVVTTDSLLVGARARASVSVEGGAMLRTEAATLGYGALFAGGDGIGLVTGAGSVWESTTLTIGTLVDTGRLTVARGGVARVGTLNLVNTTGVYVTLEDGGTLSVGNIVSQVDGEIGITGVGNRLALGQATTFTGELTGAGTLTKTGSDLTLTGNQQNFTGTLVVGEGSVVQSGGSVRAGVTVAGGASYVARNVRITPIERELRAEGGGTIVYDGVILSDGVLTGEGTHSVSGGTTIFARDGILGPTRLGAGATLVVAGDAANRAVLDLNGREFAVEGARLVNNGVIRNGRVEIRSGGVASGAGEYAGGYLLQRGGKITFGNSPGVLSSASAIWEGGASLDFQINAATGAAGASWGMNAITGTLQLVGGTAPADRFRLSLSSLLPGSPDTGGALAGFDPTANYDWEWVRTTDGISGFNADHFTLDVTGFTAHNATNGGTFGVARQGNGLFVTFRAGASANAPEPGTLALVGLAFAFTRRRGSRNEG